ncbi:hypothetical protein HYC85_008426 [Camellia sinensis]|uniref:Inhibitor I9 domain-containing protein n=1 Tax=Camellia sinensis TaxID=4442 RepID=A0A7J7HRS7_CAMSI|nr:hypothetical protein HYC85_008426 [Camellia sinensis]
MAANTSRWPLAMAGVKFGDPEARRVAETAGNSKRTQTWMITECLNDFEPCHAMANNVIATGSGQQCIFRTRTIPDIYHPHGPFTETRILLNPRFMALVHPKLVSSSTLGGEEKLFYTYNYVMHGFSAKLTPSQLSKLEKSSAHRATYQESFCKLLTTRTPKFLSLKHKTGSSLELDLLVEDSSRRENKSPRKMTLNQLGTTIVTAHTASTAARSYVLGGSHFGYARGTARGVAPSAHVAMYKVLWSTSTIEIAASDVLAGMDQTIVDGLDIMSLSLALPKTPYFEDVIALASLSAIEKGIVIVCAAGNKGDSEHNIQ